MTFRVDQKVACIKHGPWSGDAAGDETFPRFGAVYTIREFVDGDWLRLNEIVNLQHDYRGDGQPIEAAFRVDRFRPIVERKADISAFHEILRKVSRNNRVRA